MCSGTCPRLERCAHVGNVCRCTTDLHQDASSAIEQAPVDFEAYLKDLALEDSCELSLPTSSVTNHTVVLTVVSGGDILHYPNDAVHLSVYTNKGQQPNNLRVNPNCAGSPCQAVSNIPFPVGSACNDATRNWLRGIGCGIGQGYDCGHILACRLGGDGRQGNVFCQTTGINRGQYRVYEAGIADCLNRGAGPATLTWTFTGANWLRPTSVGYAAQYMHNNVCANTNVIFQNP